MSERTRRTVGRLGRTAKLVVAVASIGTAALLGAAFAPAVLGYESLIVANGSMEPKMPLGSVAVTRMVEVGAIRAGDIVSYQHPDAEMPTTHRVLRVDRSQDRLSFITKGDANPDPDPKPVGVASGRIARVEWVVPYAGNIVRLARTPAGALVVFLLPILGLLIERRKRTRAHAPGLTCTGCARAVDPGSSTPRALRPETSGAEPHGLRIVNVRPFPIPMSPRPEPVAAPVALPVLIGALAGSYATGPTRVAEPAGAGEGVSDEPVPSPSLVDPPPDAPAGGIPVAAKARLGDSWSAGPGRRGVLGRKP